MLPISSAEVLRAVAAAQPVRGLHVMCQPRVAAATELLQSCAAGCLGQLMTLAISNGSLEEARASLQLLAQLLEAGLLPAFRKLLLGCGYLYREILEALQPSILGLVRAGVAVQLLPERRDPNAFPAFRELRQAMPDPDMVLLGARKDAHAAGCRCS